MKIPCWSNLLNVLEIWVFISVFTLSFDSNKQLNFPKPLRVGIISFFKAIETGEQSEEREAGISALFTDSCKIAKY